ncbi:MAG: hypothetical protein JNL08_10115 [Planctomycetes bacterium]|nr:hypothetical protein [Planctomycetota bacterium]
MTLAGSELAAQKIQWTDASPSFGRTVAVIGDVNGGGRLDVLAGNPVTAQVKLLGTENGGSVLATLAGGSGFGESLCGLPDLDGDGSPEFAIGEPNLGRVSVYGFVGNQAVLRFQINGGAGFGSALVMIGNQAGTSTPELAIGAASGAASSSVAIYDLIARSTVTTIQRPNTSDFGRRLAYVYRDSQGRDYLAVGAPGYDSPQAQNCGLVSLCSIINGAVTIDWTNVPYATTPNSGFGERVAASADVDGNGAADVAVGHPFGAQASVSIWPLAAGQVLSAYATPSIGSQLVAVRDLQGDGRVDLVAGGGGSLTVLNPAVGLSVIPLMTVVGGASAYTGGLDAGDVFGNGSTTIVAGRGGVVELLNLGTVTRRGSPCATSMAPAAALNLTARPQGDYFRPYTNAAPNALRFSLQNPGPQFNLPFLVMYNVAPQAVAPFGACDLWVGANALTWTSGTVAAGSSVGIVVPIPANSPNLIYGGLVWQAITLGPCPTGGSCFDLSNAQTTQVGGF